MARRAAAWRPRVLSGSARGELVLTEMRVGGYAQEEGGEGKAGEVAEACEDGEKQEEVLRLRPASGTCFAGAGHRSEVAVTALAASPWGRGVDGGSIALAGSSGGHVSVVDLAAGRVSGSILSSCACAPLSLAVLDDARGRHLYGVSRRHAFTGSGHGDVVTLFDARTLDKAGTCPSSPPGRSTKGEGITGIHADGHKSAHSNVDRPAHAAHAAPPRRRAEPCVRASPGRRHGSSARHPLRVRHAHVAAPLLAAHGRCAPRAGQARAQRRPLRRGPCGCWREGRSER